MEGALISETVVAHVSQVLELLFLGYCFYRFARPFMENAAGAFWSGGAYVLTMLLLYLMPVGYFFAYGMGSLAAFGAMCWAERKNYRQKAFLSLTFFTLHWLAITATDILYDNIYNFAGRTDFMVAHPELWYVLFLGMCVIYRGMEFALLAFEIWCILKAYVYKQADMTGKELLMMAVPSVMGWAGVVIMRYYRVFYIIQTGEISGSYEILSLLYYIVSAAAVIVVITLYQNIKVKQEENLRSELLAAQIDSIRQHIGQVESLYQDIRSMKHDMANHIFTLERLYAGNKTKEAGAYSGELKAALSQAAGGIKSGNPVTDVILQEMKNAAEKKGIHFQLEFYYPEDSCINAFDISVILNNALQNALENTPPRETSRISVSSYRQNNAYMIEIRNSFSGNLQWDRQSGLPVTSRKKADGHGYGLANIRRVAEKYFGDIDIALEDGEFRLSVMLMTEG